MKLSSNFYASNKCEITGRPEDKNWEQMEHEKKKEK